ncbi:carbon-nitrogen hydrolase family protein [Sphingobium sufflavum]|uniref:carbon-nitrogen hydrolase family protein n=1 Tax=Sphingobium sufflavum TaxID=1129547 RepID=UPI001F2592A6|nr:carbon-nitrogen hydrolase family protein [Sphingobium sufflavum]MCE7797270.1 carbon-nitrogen hydrolase family protein [Sphingobium sufflavum]
MRAALLQMTTGIDPAANLATIVQAMRDAKGQGADMLFTPEMSGYLDRDRARAAERVVAEELDPVLAGVRAAAAELGLWVAIGSLAVRDPAVPAKARNRAYLIDDCGEIRARYDKMHLFDVDLPTGESWRESNSYVPGEGAVLAGSPWAAIGLSICYDLRFPDLYRTLSDAGAVILAIPAAFTVPTGEAHWHVLLRARAIEAGCFVIAAAQTGHHADGRQTYGHSLVVDPWGEVVLDMGQEAGLGIVDLDLGRVTAVRARIPALDHRRPNPDVTLL